MKQLLISLFTVFGLIQHSALANDDISCQQKLYQIWENHILETEHEFLPPLEDIKLTKLIFQSLKPKINNETDFAPAEWSKAIHARASVAQIKFVPTKENHYSGIFKGNDCGLVRISLTYTPEKRGVAPGIALKFLRDGNQPSANFSALPSLDSQGQDYNIFKKPFSNFVVQSQSLGAKLIASIFKLYDKHPNLISIENLATMDTNGIVEEKIDAPLQIFLVAPKEIQLPSLPKRDFRADLMKIKKGTILFEVYAAQKNKHTLAQLESLSEKNQIDNLRSAKKIGEIITNSDFIASEFGDSGLFFKHQTQQINR